jgi:hypothetical protein
MDTKRASDSMIRAFAEGEGFAERSKLAFMLRL